MTPRRLWGSHLSIAGGHDLAVREAHRLGFATVQVFTKNASQWQAKPLAPERIAAFKAALAETGIVRPVAHNSYLINLASPDDDLWNRSINAMVDEIERAEALGIEDLVAHPGAHVGLGEERGLERVAAGLDEVHRRTKGVRARIDLRDHRAQGTCLGGRFEHLGRIVEMVQEPERLGICADTCHLFAAGYSFAEADSYNSMIATFASTVGLDRLRVWHLNDSVREQGSRVDRHAGLGRGKMGLGPFRLIVNDLRFSNVPMILETPKGTEDGVDLDTINLGILKDLLKKPPKRKPR